MNFPLTWMGHQQLHHQKENKIMIGESCIECEQCTNINFYLSSWKKGKNTHDMFFLKSITHTFTSLKYTDRKKVNLLSNVKTTGNNIKSVS